MSFEWTDSKPRPSTKETRKTTKVHLRQFIYDAIQDNFALLTKINESTRNQYTVRAKSFLDKFSSVDAFLQEAERIYSAGFFDLEWHTMRSFLHMLRLLVRMHYNSIDKNVGDAIIDLAEDFDVETHQQRESIHAKESVTDKSTFVENATNAFNKQKLTLKMYCIALIYSEIPLRDDLQIQWQTPLHDNVNYMTTNGNTVYLHIVKSKTIPRKYNARTYTLSLDTSQRILEYVRQKQLEDGEFVFGKTKLSREITEILSRMGIAAPGGAINYVRRMHRSNAVASGNRAYMAAVRRASAHSAITAKGYTSQLNSSSSKHVQWGKSFYDCVQHSGCRHGCGSGQIYFS